MDFSSELSDFNVVIGFLIDQISKFNELMLSHFILACVLALFIISSVIVVFVRLRDK